MHDDVVDSVATEVVEEQVSGLEPWRSGTRLVSLRWRAAAECTRRTPAVCRQSLVSPEQSGPL
jgi:hypothetical protein